MCLPHLPAKWNLHQHIPPHDGYRLPRSGLHIWLHRDEGWQFWGLSTHRKILWKWHQCLFSFNDISKPLDHQAKQTVKQKLNFKFVIAYFFILRFKSNYFKSGLGFQLRYESTNVAPLMLTNKTGQCGGTFLTPNGILTSPSYPGLYPDISECVYTISRPNGTVILLDFLSMDIEYDIACNYDYLEIREGSSEASPLLDKVCGSKVPVPIKSTKSNIWMKWVQIIEYMSFVKNTYLLQILLWFKWRWEWISNQIFHRGGKRVARS